MVQLQLSGKTNASHTITNLIEVRKDGTDVRWARSESVPQDVTTEKRYVHTDY